MQLSDLAVYLLIGLSRLLGVQAVPSLGMENWSISQDWTARDGVSEFVASSEAIPEQCRANPGFVIQFPQVIHGAHEILADGRKILSFGDPSFKTVRSFYGAPVLNCKELASVTVVTWKVYCYSQYFARFSSFPELARTFNHNNLFAETFNLLAAGSLLAITVIGLILFMGRIDRSLIASVAAAGLFLAGYFVFATSGLCDIRLPMLTAHRLADICVLLGMTFFLNGLKLEGVVRRSHFYIYLACITVSILIIGAARSGDSIQLGTSLAFGPFISISLVGAYGQLSKVSEQVRTQRQKFFALLSLALFLSGFINEIFVVTGLSTYFTIASICAIFGFMFYTFSVNERIVQTYVERDHLRDHLQSEVQKQTALLEKAYQDLQARQAELVQSAKLASLGTLSAGIAHEINNSLNYVNGSIKPLEKILSGINLGAKRPQVDLLFKTANEGLVLTLAIIKSLRNYTGLNQAKFNQVSLTDTVAGVCKLINSKLKDVEIELDIPPGLSVYGSVVGINQILMNLIDNAVDAMEGKGKITVKAQLIDRWVVLQITDTGKGMPQNLQERIFEPFFTTKEVGKGTGLGLHIVHIEMKKHKGKVSVQSVENQGTTFRLEFPVVDYATGGLAA